MSRSLQRLATPRSGWKTTSKAATSRRIERQVPTRPQTVVPDSSKTLSDGLLIETSVLARLFGFKLLTLEGTVVVSPAQLRDLAHGLPDREDSAAVSRAHEAPRAAVEPPALVSTAAHPGARLGIGLAAAGRLLHESAGDLERLDRV
jgi:hypothetical protein